MKLRRVNWSNHPILGNLELDFTNQAGSACETVVIAGENGLGKTTILETINQFLRVGTITPFEYVEYEVDGQTYKASPLNGAVLDSFFNIQNCQDGSIRAIQYDRNNNAKNIVDNSFDPRHYGCVYTKARIAYETKQITSISTSVLDADTYKDKEENADTLKQLLVDIQNQDNTEFRKYAQEHSGEINLDKTFEHRYAKMRRFSFAFNSFFDQIKYKGINQGTNAHKILFEKKGREIELDNLSSGEKQIVFRGTYLLKNQNSLNGGIALVDEPEISMHPLWQQKILDYYQNLFALGGNQLTQLIVATHSSGVVSRAIQEGDKAKVVVLKGNSGSITLGDTSYPLLFNGNVNEINYQAFGIDDTEYHDALYGYIEAEGWMNEYKKGRATATYNRQHRNGSVAVENICLSEKIRHIIHHPENTHNPFPSTEEIKDSINQMRDFIKTKRGIA